MKRYIINSTNSTEYIGKSMDVIINDSMCKGFDLVQFRFPKSKKKRIRNKWKKDPRNYRHIEVSKAFVVGHRMYVTTDMFNQLRNKSYETNFI